MVRLALGNAAEPGKRLTRLGLGKASGIATAFGSSGDSLGPRPRLHRAQPVDASSNVRSRSRISNRYRLLTVSM
jgi:hypothetical protein